MSLHRGQIGHINIYALFNPDVMCHYGPEKPDRIDQYSPATAISRVFNIDFTDLMLCIRTIKSILVFGGQYGPLHLIRKSNMPSSVLL